MRRARSDHELLDLWRGGDLSAGEELFDRYYDLVYRFFSREVPSDLAALVQETFIGCLEGRQPEDPAQRFPVRLLAMAYRTLDAHLQAMARTGGPIRGDESTETDLRAGPAPGDSEDSTVQMLEGSGAMDTGPTLDQHDEPLQRAARKLPFTERVLIALHGVESLSQHDIAAIIGMPVTEVAHRLSRARTLLDETVSFTDAPAGDARRER